MPSAASWPASATITSHAEPTPWRRHLLTEIGCGLDSWLEVYAARRGPLNRSTMKGWRQALSWFDAFCGKPATLDDLPRIEQAGTAFHEQGRNAATIKNVLAKLKALQRFAAECGAVDLPASSNHHWHAV